MKNWISTLILICISYQSYAIKASVDILRYDADSSPYIEINYRVFAHSMDGSAKESNIISTIIIYQNGQIVDFQKNELIRSDSKADIVDVRRFQLAAGAYKVSVELTETNHPESTFLMEKLIEVRNFDFASISDIMLLATAKSSDVISDMVKHGVYLETQPYGYYGEDMDVLSAYVEIYDILKESSEDKYYFSYAIIEGYPDKPGETALVKYKPLIAEELQVFVLHMDISDVPSGDYHFKIAIHDKDKNLISEEASNFVRSNPKADINQLSKRSIDINQSFVQDIATDSLNYYVQAISPLVQGQQKSTLEALLDESNAKTKRIFLHKYWNDRAGEAAEAACHTYMRIARAVDSKFYNGTSRGFDTDMGYIFLRYGKPDDALEVDNELSAFPYQIWRYNFIEATGENNVKFLFYAPSLSHKDYRLLHSTCRIEYQNPAWEAELYKKLPEEQIIEGGESRGVNDGFTRRAKDLWEDF